MAKTATKKKPTKQPDLFDTARTAKSAARKAPKASARGKTSARSKASARGSGAEAGYTAKHIEVLEGLEPVRRRPGMYIGGTDEKALHHLFAEVIDNAMTAGLVIYLLATPHLPKDAFGRRKSPAASIDKDGRRSIFALLLLFVPVSLFWATYEQQGNTIALWADQFTDRRLFGAEIPVTWFQAFNPFMHWSGSGC